MSLLWPIAALLGAAGLYAVAPRRAPLAYLGPAAATVALIALPITYIATTWGR